MFKIHPLAVEDAKEFDQRPKVEDYDDFVSLVAYGARGLDEPLVEVHCFYAEHFLVSVHRDEVPRSTTPAIPWPGCTPTGGWWRCTACSTPWWTRCSRTWPRSTTASTS